MDVLKRRKILKGYGISIQEDMTKGGREILLFFRVSGSLMEKYMLRTKKGIIMYYFFLDDFAEVIRRRGRGK
jgi:hypothetical protein